MEQNRWLINRNAQCIFLITMPNIHARTHHSSDCDEVYTDWHLPINARRLYLYKEASKIPRLGTSRPPPTWRWDDGNMYANLQTQYQAEQRVNKPLRSSEIDSEPDEYSVNKTGQCTSQLTIRTPEASSKPIRTNQFILTAIGADMKDLSRPKASNDELSNYDHLSVASLELADLIATFDSSAALANMTADTDSISTITSRDSLRDNTLSLTTSPQSTINKKLKQLSLSRSYADKERAPKSPLARSVTGMSFTDPLLPQFSKSRQRFGRNPADQDSEDSKMSKKSMDVTFPQQGHREALSSSTSNSNQGEAEAIALRLQFAQKTNRATIPCQPALCSNSSFHAFSDVEADLASISSFSGRESTKGSRNPAAISFDGRLPESMNGPQIRKRSASAHPVNEQAASKGPRHNSTPVAFNPAIKNPRKAESTHSNKLETGLSSTLESSSKIIRNYASATVSSTYKEYRVVGTVGSQSHIRSASKGAEPLIKQNRGGHQNAQCAPVSSKRQDSPGLEVVISGNSRRPRSNSYSSPTESSRMKSTSTNHARTRSNSPSRKQTLSCIHTTTTPFENEPALARNYMSPTLASQTKLSLLGINAKSESAGKYLPEGTTSKIAALSPIIRTPIEHHHVPILLVEQPLESINSLSNTTVKIHEVTSFSPTKH
ncbi:hypothetical protein BC830DRAFT_900860 [Chytriomyces sp. MP71]|nr:hypothetical protein BC830DRAFT_900860 [Chytriomyces sp. MP71]